MLYQRLAGVALLLALSACKGEDSQKVETNQINVAYHVTRYASTPDELHVYAHPRRGGAVQGVDLNDGDRIEVTTDAMTQPMRLKQNLIGYEGELPPGDHHEVTFSLVRSQKASAPASKVGVLPHVTFEADPDGSTVSYAGEGLTLRWPNATPNALFVLRDVLPCGTGSASTGDDGPEPPQWADAGSLTITPAQLSPTAPPPGGTCVRLFLRHRLPGTVDPALNSRSLVEASEDLDFDVTLVP